MQQTPITTKHTKKLYLLLRGIFLGYIYFLGYRDGRLKIIRVLFFKAQLIKRPFDCK